MSGRLAELQTQIKNLLGASGVIEEPGRMEPYLTSLRNRHARTSPLVALPSSTEQVSELVKLCHAAEMPIVPQGGNTGLVDGGIPLTGGEIVVNLSRLNKIRSIDPVGSTITVEAGVILIILQDAAAEAGFLFPLSMGSEGSAQIGGAISTNAGGTAVLRYGNMRNLVLGLEVVLPDGTLISGLKKLVKDNTGYNLSHTFIGAEGTLGIVTAATLRLFPALRQKLTAVAALPDAAAALSLFETFRREGAEFLTAFEIMSREALQLVVTHIPGARFPGRSDASFYALVELGAASQHVPLQSLFESVAGAAMEHDRLLDAVIAESGVQAAQFWSLREHIPDALRPQPGRIHFDISLPQDAIVDFLTLMPVRIHKIVPTMVLLPFGHVGDGNLHYNMYLPEPGEDFAAIKTSIQNIVFGEVVRREGSISAEHGIGVERKALLLETKSAAELAVMRAIKRAIDPLGIMNPGKIFD